MDLTDHFTEQEQTKAELKKALVEIRRSEIELRTIVDALPAHAWASRTDGHNIFCNQQWLDYSGFNQETARGWTYRDTMHPEDLEPFVKKWNELSALGVTVEAEARFRRVDGEYRWFLIRALPIRDEEGNIIKWFGTNTDIDDRKNAEALLAGENKILEKIATGCPLTNTLEDLCYLVKSIYPDSVTSVTLVDANDNIKVAAAPHYPKDLLALFEGAKIGPASGSCGLAAQLKERVVVQDVATDPLWEGARELARQYGFRAGWSTPIFSSDRRVLGAFGIYWTKSYTPSPLHYEFIDQVTHLASVAIERQYSQEAIRASEKLARGQADVLTRTLDELTKESALDRIAQHVLRALISQLEAYSSGVWLRNTTSGLMDFEFAFEGGLLRSKSDPMLAAISPSLPMDAIYPWPEAFRTRRPVVFDDIREGPDFPWRSHLLDQGIITVLIVPMFAAGEPEGVIGIRFDRKREFRTEEIELAQALANQAMLALQLTRLSEKSRRTAVVAERNRMAREVHDTLAQGFTGVIVQLEAAEEAMTQNKPTKVAGHLERAGDLARESLKEARQSVKALRPRALEDNNLGRALQDLLTKMTSGTSMTPELTLDGEPRQIPLEWENNLLRIGQEVLTNAVRHSHATEFHCRLSFCSNEVSLHLRDNGIGFDPDGQHEGFGLLGIRERAETMAGKLAILSEKGRGASISIVLPFDSGIQNHESIT
jgi:PAS domain S-box-containing protein